MARLWLTLGVLTPFLAIFIAQRTSLAKNYWPWFLATHPDSAQAGEQQPGGANYMPDLTRELGQGGQQLLQVPVSPIIAHHVPSIQEDHPKDVFVRRVVAVGDLHGDFGNTQKVLEMSGVIDKEGKWTGQVDFFVQTGDIIDR